MSAERGAAALHGWNVYWLIEKRGLPQVMWLKADGEWTLQAQEALWFVRKDDAEKHRIASGNDFVRIVVCDHAFAAASPAPQQRAEAAVDRYYAFPGELHDRTERCSVLGCTELVLATDYASLQSQSTAQREALVAARRALAVAIKANWEGATDADVAEHLVIKKIDAAIRGLK